MSPREAAAQGAPVPGLQAGASGHGQRDLPLAHRSARSRQWHSPPKAWNVRRARVTEPENDRRVPSSLDQDQQRHPSRRDEPPPKLEEEQYERQ